MTVALAAERAASLYGTPGRPPVLFVHGLRLGRSVWDAHARALAHDYRVMTLDLPGHGALADVPFDTETVIALLAGACDLLGEPPLLVGYSLGGYSAIAFAHRHPDRTAGLIAVDCTYDFDGWRGAWIAALADGAASLPRPLLVRVLRVTLRICAPRALVAEIERIPFDPGVIRACRRELHRLRRFSDLLRGYDRPLLFVNGARDLLFRLDERRFLRANSHARLHLIRGADHNAPLTHAQEFVEIVRTFAEEVFTRGERTAPIGG